LAASTLVPGAPVASFAPALVLFPLALVVHARTVWVATRAKRRVRMRELMSGIPSGAIAIFVAFFAFVWAISFWSIRESRGQPVERAGHYYLNDHGDYIPVTRAEYRRAQVSGERTFTLIPAVFFALGVLMNLPRQATTEPWRDRA
jgi:hypothetical protein